MSEAEWISRSETGESKNGAWYLYLDGTAVYGYVGRYNLNTQRCNWQAVRGEYRLSESAESVEAAQAMAEQMLALPVEEFNARVVADLVIGLHELERKILRLQPTATLLPGYQTGYEAGVDDMKRKIEEVLA